MSVFVNGNRTDHVSALDRGVMYGQSVFETIAVNNGKACLLDAHLERLEKGAKKLLIPFDRTRVHTEIEHAIASTHTQQKPLDGVLRLNLTIGQGGRGYLSPLEAQTTRIISLHDYPNYNRQLWVSGIELGLVDLRLSHQPYLAGVKHGNRLEQVIARSQWQPHWQEALVLDVDDNVIEATHSNVFIVKDNCLYTPRLDKSGVCGVMRDCVISIAKSLKLDVTITSLTIVDIEQADAVFLTNSLIGLWPVKQFKKTLYSNLTLSHKILKIIKKNEYISSF